MIANGLLYDWNGMLGKLRTAKQFSRQFCPDQGVIAAMETFPRLSNIMESYCRPDGW
jgi:hypothetical protein